MSGLLQRLIWKLPEELAAEWTYDAAVDVLIVGGSIQGLCHLVRLSELGYSTALLVDGPVGSGPPTSWNGVLRRGYDDPDPELRRSVETDWQSFLDENDVDHGSDDWYALLRGRTDERLRTEWDDTGYPYEPGTPEDLPPEWLEGGLFEGGVEHGVNGIEEYGVSAHELVSALVDEHADRIVRGDVDGFEFAASGDAASIDAVEIALTSGGTLVLEPGCVVTAASGDTPDLLASIGESDGFTDAGGDRDALDASLDPVAFRDVHLLAIRAPRGALPEVSTHLLPRGLTVAVHHEAVGEGVGRVVWYVTTETFGSDDDEATGRIDPRRVGGGFSELFSVVPAVRERAEQDNSGIEFGVFAGTRHEVDGEHVEFVERGDTVSNLVISLAAPERAWLASEAVTESVADVVEPSETAGWIPTNVGNVSDPRERTNWLDWEELVVRYPESDPVSEGASKTTR